MKTSRTQLKKNHLKTNIKRMLLAGSAAALFTAAPAMAAPANLDKADTHIGQMLTAKNPHGSCTVIARIDGDLTPARQDSLTALHADVTRHLSFIQSVALTLPTRNLSKLAALPFVTHLSYDGAVKKLDAFTVGSSGAGIAFQQYGLTGQGVGVAVVDSGIGANTPDLSNPVTGQSRIIDTKGVLQDPCGHGTHVAGIIGGNASQSTGPQFTQTFYGVARQANLINVPVLDQTGAGQVSTVLAGLNWIIANKTKDNIRIVNMSLGHPIGESYTTDPLCQAVEAVWKAGIVVVCAAGNNGRISTINTAGTDNEGWGTAYGSIQSPGNDPYVITVGATKSMDGVRADDRITTYSSRGPSRLDLVLKPDIIAPGNLVTSVYAGGNMFYMFTLKTGYTFNNGEIGPGKMRPTSGLISTTEQTTGVLYQTDIDPTFSGQPTTLSSYCILSGTSMATPVVSGAAALMLQANPSLTPDTIKARLMASADKWTDPSGNPDPCTYGAGYLNIPAALASTVTPTRYALSPAMVQFGSGLYIDTTTLGSTAIWGSKALTGVNTIYGSKALTGVNTIYGSKALTGVNTIYSSKTLSGVNSIYGSKTLSGVSSIYGSSVWSDKTICGSSLNAAVDLTSVTFLGE